jgi:hypothetical protein
VDKEKIKLETVEAFKGLSQRKLFGLCLQIKWVLFTSHPVILFLRSLVIPYAIVYLGYFIHGSHVATLIAGLMILPVHGFMYYREQQEEAEEILARNTIRERLSYRLKVLWQLTKRTVEEK